LKPRDGDPDECPAAAKRRDLVGHPLTERHGSSGDVFGDALTVDEAVDDMPLHRVEPREIRGYGMSIGHLTSLCAPTV
jgi:hypothetical protein